MFVCPSVDFLKMAQMAWFKKKKDIEFKIQTKPSVFLEFSADTR
jgi:hypothetical protein